MRMETNKMGSCEFMMKTSQQPYQLVGCVKEHFFLIKFLLTNHILKKMEKFGAKDLFLFIQKRPTNNE